jgi:hypothetical protein
VNYAAGNAADGFAAKAAGRFAVQGSTVIRRTQIGDERNRRRRAVLEP